MNSYGTRALTFWREQTPTRRAAIPDPTQFFTRVGLEIEAAVTDLALQLAGPDLQEETYLQKVARLTSARRQAEEVVMSQLVWQADPDLPLDQAREEWEQTRPSDENLIAWAERMQDFPDSIPSTLELEQLAQKWALSTEFLEGLLASEPPREYMLTHQAELSEAATMRFLRELH